jgi:hypothetical protein
MSGDTSTPTGPFTLRLLSVDNHPPARGITRDSAVPHVSPEEVDLYAGIVFRARPEMGWEKAREIAFLARLGRAEEKAEQAAEERARQGFCGIVLEFPRRGGVADTA